MLITPVLEKCTLYSECERSDEEGGLLIGMQFGFQQRIINNKQHRPCAILT